MAALCGHWLIWGAISHGFNFIPQILLHFYFSLKPRQGLNVRSVYYLKGEASQWHWCIRHLPCLYGNRKQSTGVVRSEEQSRGWCVYYCQDHFEVAVLLLPWHRLLISLFASGRRKEEEEEVKTGARHCWNVMLYVCGFQAAVVTFETLASDEKSWLFSC